MGRKKLPVLLVLMILLISCQPAVSTPETTPTFQGQVETLAAASLSAAETLTAAVEMADQTSTAFAKVSPFQAALTADVMTAAARTPVPTSTAKKFNVDVPADACWMNSEVPVLTGQRVIITASGTVNTWEGREGSSSNPDGQTGICGAIECPLQGEGYGALIGRVEDLEPFYVGPYAEFVATKEGDLYFTVNDWQCEDNSGIFALVITVP